MTRSLADVLRHGANPLRGQAPARVAERRMRVLFLVSAHNSLSQRVYIALTELGHDVLVAVVDSGEAMEAAVADHRPELIVCPILKKMIPESIWATHRCLIVHPGPRGDRGPSSLDWAIRLGMGEWGVTVLEATGEADAGDIWATRTFPTRAAGKSSLYRHEVRRAAVEAVRGGRDEARGGRRVAAAARLRRPAGHRPPASADQAAGAGHRLGLGRDGDGDPQDPRRRGAPRRPRQGREHTVPSVRRPPRAGVARSPGRDHRPAKRRDLPGHGRRRGLDHAPQARRRGWPDLLQASRDSRARPRRQ